MGQTTVTADGATLWFDVSGKAGDPLLLVAGNALDHGGWDGVMEAFTARHRVIRYDHRGTGGSSANVPSGATTRDFARDAAAVLAAAGFARAHVYGHSMGGRIARWLAIDAPDKVGALVLGASSFDAGRGVDRPPAAMQALGAGDAAALQRMFYPDDWIAANETEAARTFPRPLTPEARQAHMYASTHEDGWDLLPGITAPTLVIHGDDDTLTMPGNAPLLAGRIPGATLQMVKGGRHVYWAGRPDVDAAILGFLAAHPL